MFNFQKQAAFQTKLVQIYTGLADSLKADVSPQDFIEEFPIIEVNGRGVPPDKPGAASAFLLTDDEFAQVLAAFDAVYNTEA